MTEQYCKIYLNTSATLDVVKGTVSGELGGAVEGRTISAHGLVVDVFSNRAAAVVMGPEFLGWPYYLDVEAMDGCSLEHFIDVTARLIRGLSTHGIQSVPCCEFEDQLKAFT